MRSKTSFYEPITSIFVDLGDLSKPLRKFTERLVEISELTTTYAYEFHERSEQLFFFFFITRKQGEQSTNMNGRVCSQITKGHKKSSGH